jgi:hypothetical protein
MIIKHILGTPLPPAIIYIKGKYYKRNSNMIFITTIGIIEL